MPLTRVIDVNIPVGVLAALLTAIEYVLSTISALAIRASLHGFWLLKLHRGGKASLDTKQRLRSGLRRDIIGAILGIWLVVGVALVEANLRSGVRVSRTTKKSTECVSVYGKYRSERIHENIPPYRTILEPWVVRVASDLDCGKFGITSVGVGGYTDILGEKQNMSAPYCGEDTIDFESDQLLVNITSVEVDEEYFESEMSLSDGILLLPKNTTNLGRDKGRIGTEGEGICNQVGISNYFYSVIEGLETEFAHGLNISLGIHERLCSLHNPKPISTAPMDTVASCAMEDDGLDVACIREKLEDRFIYTVTISDVSALMVGRGLGPSYACLDATVQHEYIFIAPESIRALQSDSIATFPVLLIISARVVNASHCERTIAPLAQAAMLYSADAEWRKDKIAMLEPRKRYYAYIMAVSNSQFPLNGVSGEEDPNGPDGCVIRPVFEVTEIPVDWRLFVLITGFIFVLIVTIVGGIFRLQFSGESWAVGSAQWSLARLLQTGREPVKTVVEVVPVQETKEEIPNTQSSRSSLRLPNRSSIGVAEEGAVGWRRPKGRCEYRMRTVADDSRDAESSRDQEGTRVEDIEAPVQNLD